MTRRSKVWLGVSVFTVINAGGAVFAAAGGELLHAAVHAGLLLLGAYFVWRLAPSSYAGRVWRQAGSVIPAPPGELSDRLTQLEQSLDAVAIEVERIGDGQRFMTRLFTEKGAARAPEKGAAAPIEIKDPEAPR
ncbi:MAG: hypothetical protein M3Z10_13745 [Gemmatimonadota bacterium]|nr:hypothetical protein [Gemmatimonadota bacterium]